MVTTTPTRSLARTIGIRGLALGLVVLAPTLIGCSSGGDKEAADAIETIEQADAVVAEATADLDQGGASPVPVDDPAADGANDAPVSSSGGPGSDIDVSTGEPSGGEPSGGAPSSPQPVAAAPVITSFETPESIDCHNGDFQEFTASWTTTGAVKVMISIDGPGGYAEYAANGEASLPFTCTSAHSFLLTAYGEDGQTATSSVTLQPRNVQVPEAEQADEED